MLMCVRVSGLPACIPLYGLSLLCAVSWFGLGLLGGVHFLFWVFTGGACVLARFVCVECSMEAASASQMRHSLAGV